MIKGARIISQVKWARIGKPSGWTSHLDLAKARAKTKRFTLWFSLSTPHQCDTCRFSLSVVCPLVCPSICHTLPLLNTGCLLCRLRSIVAHMDHFVRRLSVHLSVCLSVCLSYSHTFFVVIYSYVSQATHAFLGLLLLFFLKMFKLSHEQV